MRIALAGILFVSMNAVPSISQEIAGGVPCEVLTSKLLYVPNRLKTYGTNELLVFFTSESQEENRDAVENYLEEIRKEILVRGPVQELVCVLERSNSFSQLSYTSDLLTEVADRRLDSRLKIVALADISVRSYLALRYFAQRGDIWALEQLNAHFYQYPVSSVLWAETVDLFGKYYYLPAARNMAKGVSSASLNLVAACLRTLEVMFPDQHPAFAFFPSPKASQYWEDYVVRHTK